MRRFNSWRLVFAVELPLANFITIPCTEIINVRSRNFMIAEFVLTARLFILGDVPVKHFFRTCDLSFENYALLPLCYRLCLLLLLSWQITSITNYIKMFTELQNLTTHFPQVSVLFLVYFVNSSTAYQCNCTWQGDQIKVLCFCSLVNKRFCHPADWNAKLTFWRKLHTNVNF